MKATSIKLHEIRKEAKVTTISQAIKACYAQCINGGDDKAKETTAIFGKYSGINGVLAISGVIYKAMHIGEAYTITKGDAKAKSEIEALKAAAAAESAVNSALESIK